MSHSSFLKASLAERLGALFPDQPVPLPGSGASDLLVAEARRDGRDCILVASDPARQLGTLGTAECADFLMAVAFARARRLPLVLLFDSAGARLDAGLPIQGALRRLVRAMLDARLDRLPMLALLGRYAFGAASMLVCAAQQRCHAAEGQLAMSGPRVLQGAGEGADVKAVISGHARCALGSGDRLLEDSLSAYAQALSSWLAAPVADMPAGVPAHQTSVPHEDGVIPFGAGQPAGLEAAARLTSLLEAGATAGSRWTIVTRCPGHSLQLADEAGYLSLALARLALAVRRATRAGALVSVRIEGEISGGIFLALAAGASSVSLAPGARVLTLPPSSLAQILGSAGEAQDDLAAHLALGVVDHIEAA